jgi:hypothetical protein
MLFRTLGASDCAALTQCAVSAAVHSNHNRCACIALEEDACLMGVKQGETPLWPDLATCGLF